MVFDFTQLLNAAEAVNEELAAHTSILTEEDLTPEDREHIQRNLACGCARGLQVIALHQRHLSLKLDELAVEMADA